MNTEPNNYVSVMGGSLIEPLITLLEVLEATPTAVPNEVQTGMRENGYSAAIIVLASVIFESAINRTCYIRGDTIKGGAVKYFTTLVSDPELSKDIEEVIAVRDAFVHNHLWLAQSYWDDDGNLKFTFPPKRIKGYGNKRLEKVMNPDTRLSRRLELNLFPPRIWRRDAYITVKIVNQALEAIESLKREYFYISDSHFSSKERYITLNEPQKSVKVLILTHEKHSNFDGEKV